ncbi:hypothetical protein QL285_059587 [Trifolium repens]|nr:hypothetical protein QL285_059587 [Trifolium repens]
MPEQEKENKREVWRKKFYKKFSIRDDWAEMDDTFWNESYAMMKGAKVVYQKKVADAAQVVNDAQVTPLENEMKGAKIDYEKKLSDAAQVFTVEVTLLEKEMKSAKVVYAWQTFGEISFSKPPSYLLSLVQT